MMTIKNTTQNELLAVNVKHCRSLWSRVKGLLGTSHLGETEACWIAPCNSIHTFGMKYSIDAYFLDRKNQVVGIVKNMKPGRLSPVFFNAYSVMEFSVSDKRNCLVGDKLCAEENKAQNNHLISIPEEKTSKLAKTMGQSTLEFAWACMFLFAVLYAMTDMVKICYSWVSLQYALNESTRKNSLGSQNAATIASEVAKQLGVNADIDIYDNTETIVSHYSAATGLETHPTTKRPSGDPSSFIYLKAHSVVHLGFVSDLIFRILGKTSGVFDVYVGTIIKNEPFS